MSGRKVKIVSHDEKLTSYAIWAKKKRPVSLGINIVLIVSSPHRWSLSICLIANLIPQVISLTLIVTLLWHRCEWGFQEWIHEYLFINFWNGTYVVITGKQSCQKISGFGLIFGRGI